MSITEGIFTHEEIRRVINESLRVAGLRAVDECKVCGGMKDSCIRGIKCTCAPAVSA